MNEHKVIRFHAYPGDISIQSKIALKDERSPRGRSFRRSLKLRSKKRQRRRDKETLNAEIS